jgi:hypothetical protein
MPFYNFLVDGPFLVTINVNLPIFSQTNKGFLGGFYFNMKKIFHIEINNIEMYVMKSVGRVVK